MSLTTGGQFAASSNPADAFQVSANVPEPSIWALLCLGIGMWWLAACRRVHA